MGHQGRKLSCLVLIILLLLLILLYLKSQAPDPDSPDGSGTDPGPVATNTAPSAGSDDFKQSGPRCVLSGSAPFVCTVTYPAGSLTANDSDPEGHAFSSHIAGTDIAGRACSSDHLCSTDAHFDPAGSSVTVAPDGGFTLTFATNLEPVFLLIAEFQYVVEETQTADRLVSNTATVEVAVESAD